MGGAARRRVNRAAAAPASGGKCAFCGSAEQDETTVGRLYIYATTTVHYYCALLSCGLVQHGSEEEGLFGFLLEDILAELQRGKKLKCSYCSSSGATVACCLSHCRKMFHLPCGRRRGSVSIFGGNYSSYCTMHAPMQTLPDAILTKAKQRKALAKKSKPDVAPASGNTTAESCEDALCAICYEEVEPWPSTSTFWPPCCARDRWLHVPCVQRMALSAGMHYLKCPLCNDKDTFQKAITEHGVYIPDRDAAWELEEQAFAELYERPKSCSAEPCRCYEGREYDADQGRWELKLCLICGSVAVHLGCLDSPRHVCAQCAVVPDLDLDALESIPLTRPRDAESFAPEFRPLMSHRLSVQRTKTASAKPDSSSTMQADVLKLDRVVKIIHLENDDDEPDVDVDIELADEPSCSNTQSDPNSARTVSEKPKYNILKWLLDNDTNRSCLRGRFLKLERDKKKTWTDPNSQCQNYKCLWKELIDKSTKTYETNDLEVKTREKSTQNNDTVPIQHITVEKNTIAANPINEKIMIINNEIESENSHSVILEQTSVMNNEIVCNNSGSNESIFKDNSDNERIDLTTHEMFVDKNLKSVKSQKSRHNRKLEKVVDENSTKALEKNATTITAEKNATIQEFPTLDDTPKKPLQKTMLNMLEDNLLSPLKTIEQKIYSNLTDGDDGEIELRIHHTVMNMKKPRPKSVIEILENLLEDCDTPSTAHIEELTDQETVQNESALHSLSDSPILFNAVSKVAHSTPSKDNLDIARQSADKALTIDLLSSFTRRISICSEKDDTLNSSTDSTKVEIQDSALEISCKEKVSIDFVRPSLSDIKMQKVKRCSIFDEYDLLGSDCNIEGSHLKLKKKDSGEADSENFCESAENVQNTKISLTHASEKLKMYEFDLQNKALTEFESLKSQYLSEVGQYKCNFNHKHDTSTKITKSRIKTVIDFAIEAAVKKRRELKRAKRSNSENDATEQYASNLEISESIACKLDKSQLKFDKKLELSSNAISKSEENTFVSNKSAINSVIEPKQTVLESVIDLSMPEKVITPRKSIEVLQNLITVFENKNAASGNIILPSLSVFGSNLSPEKPNIANTSTLKNSSSSEPPNKTDNMLCRDSTNSENPNNSSLENSLFFEKSNRTLNLYTETNSSTEKFNTSDNTKEGTVKRTFSPEKQSETILVPKQSQTSGNSESDPILKKLLSKPGILENSNLMLAETNKITNFENSDGYTKVQTVECPSAHAKGPPNFDRLVFVDSTDKPSERTILTSEIQNLEDYKSILYEKRELTQKVEELEGIPVTKRQDERKRKRDSSVGNERKKVKHQMPEEITKTINTKVAGKLATKCTKRLRNKIHANEIDKLQVYENIEVPITRGRRPKQKIMQKRNEKKGKCGPLVQNIAEEIAANNTTDDEKRNERIGKKNNKKEDLSIQSKVKPYSGKKKLKYKTLAEDRHDIHNNSDRKSIKNEMKNKKTKKKACQNTEPSFVEEVTETHKQKNFKQKRKFKQQQNDEPKTKQKTKLIHQDEHDFVNELDKVNEFYRKGKKKKKHQNTEKLKFAIQIAPKLKQSVLNFSPDSKMTLTSPPNDKNVTSQTITQNKKKKLKDFSPDGLKQTTLNNFFPLHFTLN